MYIHSSDFFEEENCLFCKKNQFLWGKFPSSQSNLNSCPLLLGAKDTQYPTVLCSPSKREGGKALASGYPTQEALRGTLQEQYPSLFLPIS